jgi:hypothetical protein
VRGTGALDRVAWGHGTRLRRRRARGCVEVARRAFGVGRHGAGVPDCGAVGGDSRKVVDVVVGLVDVGRVVVVGGAARQRRGVSGRLADGGEVGAGLGVGD